MILAPFVCLVQVIHDGDGPYWCKTGEKVRLAGVQSPDFEDAEPCRQHRSGYTCNNVAATQARDIVSHMILGHTLECVAVGRSWKRIVARCRIGGQDLSCAVIAAGGGTRWNSYWRKYRMPDCR